MWCHTLCCSEADRFQRVEHLAGSVHRLNVMFIPPRRYVTASKPAAAGYGNRIRISPNNRLHVQIDIADKDAAAHIGARRHDADNVSSRGNVAAGASAERDIAVSSAIGECISSYRRIEAASRVFKERAVTDDRLGSRPRRELESELHLLVAAGAARLRRIEGPPLHRNCQFESLSFSDGVSNSSRNSDRKLPLICSFCSANMIRRAPGF